MKRRIKRIAPLQAGKMMGVIYACLGLIFVPFLMLAGAAGAFAQHTQTAPAAPGAPAAAALTGMFLGMGIFLPVFYGVMGFIGGVIGAAIYNLIARWIGGIEVEVE